MKRTYMKPTTTVVEIRQQQQMLAGSVPVSDTETTNQFAPELDGFDWNEDDDF